MRYKPDRPAPPQHALALKISHMTKRFGSFTALDDVSISVAPGSFHALLGENGAGKSTLVKCLVGFYRPDAGQVEVDDREVEIRSPQDSHALGIGMVYQHFTLVPSMSAAENLVMSRAEVPAVVRWREERERLAAFMKTVPFKVPLDKPVSALAAGEKQKLEILKQLYLDRRFMILDEPTSVLTPAEADEVLGMLKDLTRARKVTILMITHKFREVMAFADTASVLRRGKLTGEGRIGEVDASRLAEMMVGSREIPHSHATKAALPAGEAQLVVKDLVVEDDAGRVAVDRVSFSVRKGEILGIAGVSGNGQRELVQALVGQRLPTGGAIRVAGEPYHATRAEIAARHVFSLPEEPLRNACVPGMSVADNMALRTFDRAPLASGIWLRAGEIGSQAERLIGQFKVATRGPFARIETLSGGNVQRAVLARELSQKASVLIVQNPVFGLDFAAVAEIHDRIVAARNDGAAVLLVSEDLDELLELSDRVAVIFDGRLVYEVDISKAEIPVIGRWMAGHAEAA
ncbi:MAG: ABC transporter ATP-binding protein [Betaproteobacteria bacterium]|nr:ABC transporter ATP-binding protein [Betaproteobacteria bacterium]